MLIAPENKVIIQVETKYTKAIGALLKRASIENMSTVDTADFVNIFGTVISLPSKCSDRLGLEGYSADGLKIGDKIMFSYSVIHEVFTFVGDDTPKHKNLFYHNGKEYFFCDISNIYAVIRGEEVIMLNGYVMLKNFIDSMIFVPNKNKQIRGVVSSEIVAVGEPRKGFPKITAQPGDTGIYSPMRAIRYEPVPNKPFVILPQHKLFGIYKKGN